MDCFHSLEDYSKVVDKKTPVVITIGNFDGVHLGHQRLLKQLHSLALRINFQINQANREFENLLNQAQSVINIEIKQVLISFQTPIDTFIKGDLKPTITTYKQKVKLLKKYSNLDYFIDLPVDHQLVSLTAEEFVVKLLQHLNIKLILIGDDFKLGKNRSGDFDTLVQFGNKYGFKVEQANSLILDSMRVSSTLIRNLLHNSEFHTAASYLGYEYAIEGTVVHGQQLARQWNVPTANILMDLQKSPLRGVYICAILIDDKTYFGATNIGTRPTLKDSSEYVWYCETHIFDFNDDLYGQEIKVIPLNKIRDENKFPTLESLRKRIYDDICTARTWLTYSI